MRRTLTLQVKITTPATVGENEIVAAINRRLDEETTDPIESEWPHDWYVGPVTISHVTKHK